MQQEKAPLHDNAELRGSEEFRFPYQFTTIKMGFQHFLMLKTHFYSKCDVIE